MSLWAISPLDGRYRDKLLDLGRLVSEGALIGYRVKVEAAWLEHLSAEESLSGAFELPPTARAALQSLARGGVDPKAAERIKAIEATTNHDVKAVEYYLRELLETHGSSAAAQAFIHFACTSEDINNLSYALMQSDVRRTLLVPAMDELILDLARRAAEFAALPMLARTHGQTATPTTLGKELAVFAHRLDRQRARLISVPMLGKINGAVGNYNAHLAAFPKTAWPRVAEEFVGKRLGLTFNPLTTQIESHDAFVEYCDAVKHFNAVLLGFCRDVWGYVSLGYFRQRAVSGEVGSSTMPHKINPIDFENAEGNLGLANSLASHFSDKLTISRWQRDLSDSTVLRAFGHFVGHSLLAYRSVKRGLAKLGVDPARMKQDLDGAYEVLAEPIQTVMRRYGVKDAYERLKSATRGEAVTRAALQSLVDGCVELPKEARDELKRLTPERYTGAAADLARGAAARLLSQHQSKADK